MHLLATSGRHLGRNRAAVIGLIGILLVLVAPPASKADQRWKSDDCATLRHKDEKGFVWYEHVGDESNERCYGTGKRDVFWTKSGDDVVRGLGGPDAIHLGHGRDRGYGSSGYDYIYGGQEKDVLYGGRGNDRLLDGNPFEDWDCLVGGPGKDRVDMGDGDMMDDFWAGKGFDPYPTAKQFDSFCKGNGSCTQDGIWDADNGPCDHQDCSPPYSPKTCTED